MEPDRGSAVIDIEQQVQDAAERLGLTAGQTWAALLHAVSVASRMGLSSDPAVSKGSLGLGHARMRPKANCIVIVLTNPVPNEATREAEITLPVFWHQESYTWEQPKYSAEVLPHFAQVWGK
jgi:hypothetical protein